MLRVPLKLNDVSIENCEYIFSSVVTPIFYVALTLVITILILVLINHIKRFKRIQFFVSFVLLTGGLGNAIDRLDDGCVTDYLDFFGLFMYNFYDVLVCVSCAYFLIYIIKNDKQ